MRRVAHGSRRARTARTGMLMLALAILSTAGLAACGGSASPAPLSAAPSVPPTASQTPTASDSAPTPGPSSEPGAASSAPIPSDAVAGLDACALLTPAEVAKILGDSAVQAKPMPSGGWVAGQCAWNGPTSGFFLSVGTVASIAAFGDPSAADAKAKLAQFRATGAGSKDVAGIGDGAAVAATGVAAYSGGTYLEITNLGLTEDQLIEIAKLAVARL